MTIKQRFSFKNFINKKLKPQLKLAMDDIRHPANHPKTTAQSMALGMFIAIFIPMGLQVWTLAALLLIMRFNILIATLVTLISNPVTIVPIYYSGIVLGETITGQNFPWQYYDMFIKDPQIDYIIKFGHDGAFVFLSGLFVMGLILALVTYILAYRFAMYLQHKKAMLLQK